jgi:asparagine N-glycosylation enzyme membrane subunit Stt3
MPSLKGALRRLWRWPLLLAMAVFLFSLAAALRAAMPGTDGHLIYSLDDAYIHMAVAKNFANAGIWGCTPFHFCWRSGSGRRRSKP